MTSNDSEVSERDLINLIYLHLKKNGHEIAANVLKKNAPQVEPSSVKVSLNEIFNKWLSDESEKKNNEGGGPLGNCSGSVSSFKSSASKTKRPRNAGHSIISRKKDKLQTVVAGNRKRKRKENKFSGSAKGQTAVPEHTSKNRRVGDDSDSDSSLDVEKWKRLALQLSDTDIAKMDVLTNPGTPTASFVEKSPKKRKQAQIKKDGGNNTKAKPSTRKSKAKSEKPSKSVIKKKTSVFLSENVIGQSKKKKDKPNLSEPQEVELPVIEMTGSLTEQAVISITENPSKNGTTKKIKHKKKASKSVSNNIKMSAKSPEAQKLDNLSGLRLETPYKKAKGNKSLEPTDMDNPLEAKRTDCMPAETPSKKAKSKKSVKPLEPVDINTSKESDTEVASSNLLFHQSEKNEEHSSPKVAKTHSKKVKSNKSLKTTEPVYVNIPPKEKDTGIDHSHLIFDLPPKNEISDPKLIHIPFKKTKSKKSLQPSEPVDVSTLSRKADAEVANRYVSSDQSETPSKIAKAKKTDTPNPTKFQTPSEKTKAKRVQRHPEAENVSTPPGECPAEDVHGQSKLATSVVEAEHFRKVKAMKTESIAETSGIENPSKKMESYEGTAISEAVHSQPPSKKSKHQIGNSLTETHVLETPSKKSKKKKSVEADQAVSPSKKACLDVGGANEMMCSSKKSKSKKSNIKTNDNEITDDLRVLLTDQNIVSEETSCPISTQDQNGKKKTKSKVEEDALVLEECPAELKKRKKKKKASKESVAEDVPLATLSEELVDTPAKRQEKRKKKKKKDRDEENQLASSPTAEEEAPKKKKKSLKEKECINDVAPEGQI